VKDQNTEAFVDSMKEFLALCKDELKLEKLPTIHWINDQQLSSKKHTFGVFVKNDQTIHIMICNRHPLDIMRTLAHELTHFKQWTEGRINAKSGDTGSTEENEANSTAGVVMRKFNRANPEFFNLKPIV
jgi:hypothetical protein